jgi:hypothetical protein
LIAKSADFGRTWTTMGESNLPMTTSKPAAGLLRNSRSCLICTNAANNGGRRATLTIAISEPDKEVFSKVFVIRQAEHSGPGESNPKASLSYPCATGHDGKIYVGFSNNGGRRGNLNSAEMGVIPIEKLNESNTPHTCSFNPFRRNHDLSSDIRNAMLVLRKLRDDQIDCGSGQVIALLINAGKTGHRRRPVVHDEADVLGNAQAKSLQPAGHMRVKSDQCVRLVLAHPIREGVEALTDVVAREKQQRHPIRLR